MQLKILSLLEKYWGEVQNFKKSFINGQKGELMEESFKNV